MLVKKKVKMSDLLDYPHDPDQPIALFDSGVGGLTVAAAVRHLLPNEDIVYLGDTARVPYGIKSAATVSQFARQLAGWLLQYRPKLMVVACNTLSAVAMPQLEAMGLQVLGVVEPGARAAAALSAGRTVAVLATEATVNSGAYVRRDPRRRLLRACGSAFLPALCAHGGRGSRQAATAWSTPRPMSIWSRFVGFVRAWWCSAARIILSCATQSPVPLTAGPVVVDSAEETAWTIQRLLKRNNQLSSRVNTGRLRCYATDNPERFRKIGTRFCGEPLEHVELVPLDDIVAMDLQLASP